MANTTNTKHLCMECGFCRDGVCRKTNLAVFATQVACFEFRTIEDVKKEYEEKLAALRRKEEERLNFLLTALYISSTCTMQLLEYFDSQFQDKKVEGKWRFERKRAAGEIDRCVKRIRDVYQYTFMEDHMAVMTGHGKREFDAEAYDNHEDDARRWNKLLLHHMESSWQSEKAEEMILKFYESMPHVGIFCKSDFKHFTTKR